MTEEATKLINPTTTATADLGINIGDMARSIATRRRQNVKKQLDAHQKLLEQRKKEEAQAKQALDAAWAEAEQEIKEKLVSEYDRHPLSKHLDVGDLPWRTDLPEGAVDQPHRAVTCALTDREVDGNPVLWIAFDYTLQLAVGENRTLVAFAERHEHPPVDSIQAAKKAHLDAKKAVEDAETAVKQYASHLAQSHDWENIIHSEIIHSVTSGDNALRTAWDRIESEFAPHGADRLPNLIEG